MMRKNFYGTGNDAFACENCGQAVAALTNGSFRNHCSHCLWCKHVDVVSGDRQAECQVLMEPVRAEQHSKKGWMVVHSCTGCGFERRNIVAPDDDFEQLLELM